MAARTEVDAGESFSHVVIVGRLGARIDTRALPSGDVVTVFTVVVDRSMRRRPAGSPHGASVDAIACQSFRTTVNRRLEGFSAGDRVRVEGTLHRRFWRSGGGLGSAMEVDVSLIKRATA